MVFCLVDINMKHVTLLGFDILSPNIQKYKVIRFLHLNPLPQSSEGSILFRNIHGAFE